MARPYWALSAQQVVAEFDVDQDTGLTDQETMRRLEKYGPNAISAETTRSAWLMLFWQLANSMTLVLAAAVVVSFVTNDYAEAIVILVMIFANTLTGFYQEYRSEQTMAALRSMASPSANLIRNGELCTISAAEVVPGDILLLKCGDNVAADCRIIDCQILGVDEALLTGETHQVEKHSDVIDNERAPVADQYNMVFASTTVTQGRGRAVVVRIGMTTELGKIARSMFLMDRDRSKTPLQRSLSNMGWLLISMATIFAFIVFAVNHFDISTSTLLYAVAVTIAVIPEGLVAVVTLTMALGMRQMSKQRVLIRKLVALELLGRVTNVCSDKTGTLTQAVMTVTRIWLPGDGVVRTTASAEAGESPGTEPETGATTSAFHLFGRCASLCNMADLRFGPRGEFLYGIGDPTEIALQKFAHLYGMGKEAILSESGYILWAEHAFDSQHKRMTVIYQNPVAAGAVVFTKGAPEHVLPRCESFLRVDRRVPISDEQLADEVYACLHRFSSQGLRTMLLAMRFLERVGSMETARKMPRKDVESQLTFLGLVGISDPPRPESRISVAMCHEAGIAVQMLTGDHLLTATTIATQVGILPGPDADQARCQIGQDAGDLVMPATEFDDMTDHQIDALATLPGVVARCSPQTKVRMIQALHRRNRLVAMTGDGVNDSPSLKLADVGISMGQNSSDVAKQVSDIVLTDNNFASIVKGIAEGRRLFRNIQRLVAILIGGNIAELFVLMIGLVFKDAGGQSVFPLSPIQILVNNLLAGTPSAFALCMEKQSPDSMKQPPRPVTLGLFDVELVTDIIWFGFVIGAITLFDFYAAAQWFGNGVLESNCDEAYTYRCDNLYRARGVAFAVLTVLILLHTYNCRDLRGRMWTRTGLRHLLDNPAIPAAVATGFTIVIVSLYVPFLNDKIFKQRGFGVEWVLVVASIIVFIVISDIYKTCKSCILPPFH